MFPLLTTFHVKSHILQLATETPATETPATETPATEEPTTQSSKYIVGSMTKMNKSKY